MCRERRLAYSVLLLERRSALISGSFGSLQWLVGDGSHSRCASTRLLWGPEPLESLGCAVLAGEPYNLGRLSDSFLALHTAYSLPNLLSLNTAAAVKKTLITGT